MLDTNTVSYIIKGKPAVIRDRLQSVPMANVCISSITEAELRRGVERKVGATRLRDVVNEFLLRVDTFAWDSDAANAYAILRTSCEKEGKSLGAMDMLIAAHSVSANAILVTNDKAFYSIEQHLKLEDWSLT